MNKKHTFGDLTGEEYRLGGSHVVTKKKISGLHKGTKAQAEARANAGPLAEGTQMPRPEDELKKVRVPHPIPVEETGPRMIKKRK